MEYDKDHLLVDDGTWAILLEAAFHGDPSTAKSLAQLLFTVQEALDAGQEGIKRARATLLQGVELAYLYTDTHKAALKLYLLYLSGCLKPDDEPLGLINEAIASGKAEVEQARGRQVKRVKR